MHPNATAKSPLQLLDQMHLWWLLLLLQ